MWPRHQDLCLGTRGCEYFRLNSDGEDKRCALFGGDADVQENGNDR